MRKLQFSLQAALDMRRRTVEAAEDALRAAQEEWNQNQQAQEALAAELRSAEISVRSGPVNPADFMAMDRYRGVAQRQQKLLVQESTALGRSLAERRAEWQAAERDRTLLIRLKEKALAQWQAEHEKEQQQLAEEAYLSRWGR